MKVILIMVSILFFMTGCGRAIRSLQGMNDDYYGNLLETSRNWLKNNAGKPNVNIDGMWSDMAMRSWGDPVFLQISNTIAGSMSWNRRSPYSVEGSVNGNMVYLILTYDGYLYYTMVLKSSSNTMMGKYYYSYDSFNITDSGYDITLYRSSSR